MLKTLTKMEAQDLMNQYGASKTPFLFIIDYKMEKAHVLTLAELDKNLIRCAVLGENETQKNSKSKKRGFFEALPIDFETYEKAFEEVQQQIQAGNTYLTNLTFSTPILTSFSLLDIYEAAEAKYKLWLNKEFVVFSPETFVQIEKGKIASFPMKGTIDASLENALEQLKNDPKEKAEHATIVDLIRNDLSSVATKVRVEKYRYFEKIQAGNGSLIQSSSKIIGDLPADYEKKLGDILFSLLPAGSITGAPKKKTLEIIAAAENYARNFYTGVFGVFDGDKLDSGVAIRFVEQQKSGFVFKSGGGITAFSEVKSEYQELLTKVYLPIPKLKQEHESTPSFIRNH